MKRISSLIDRGRFQEALEGVESCEARHSDDAILQFNKPPFLVAIGIGLGDHRLLAQALDIGERNLRNYMYAGHDPHIHYNLANGYASLYYLTERNLGVESIPRSANLQKAKEHLRDALRNGDESRRDLRKQVFVNYGNCLDMLGRGVEAFDAYDAAIAIDEHFSMAIGNRAKALRFFADISGRYRGAIYVEAYQAIKSIIDNQDLIAIGGLSARKSFEDELQGIASRFKDKTDLTKRLAHPNYSTTNLSTFEEYYLAFCAKEKLFLNFHVHDTQCESAITDPIFISLITPIEDDDTFYRLAKSINQIKEDYAVARLLLVQSQFKREDFDSISRRTTFVNTLDYSQFNLYSGLLKSAFKEAYNILDKIAVFINDYYNLGLRTDRIYFTTIWQLDGRIRDRILESKNISLYALYDIYQDFKSGYYEPLQAIRNASTHRKLVICDSVPTDSDKKDDKENIGYSTMLGETVNLMRLAKSSIIYLINCVNIEENRKRGSGLIPTIVMDTSQFL
ncbi:MAG TPA: LA2681 family HEPN domain-containing protein [Candidatus Cryosericum sp.]